MAQRSGISGTTVYKVEAGGSRGYVEPYVRVLAVLGLESDLNELVADDKVGRKLQDLALEPQPAPARRTGSQAKKTNPQSSSADEGAI